MKKRSTKKFRDPWVGKRAVLNGLTTNAKKPGKIPVGKSLQVLRIDPTRTGQLRKDFSSRVSRGFARLRGLIVKLVVDEDAFGIRERKPFRFLGNEEYASTQLDLTDPAVLRAARSLQSQIDPADVMKLEENPHVTVRYGLDPGVTAVEIADLARAGRPVEIKVKGLSLFRTPKYDVLKYDVESTQLEEMNRRLGNVPHTDTQEGFHPHLTVAYLRPGTGDRYTVLPGIEYGTTMTFGVVQLSDEDRVKTPVTVNAGRFAFQSDPEKVKGFQKWLKQQYQSIVKGKTEEELWRRYTMDGFRKGAGRAFDDAKKMERAIATWGRDMDFYDGTREQFLRDTFAQPESVDKVKLLAGRSFDELDGVTADMSLKMSRALTDGLVQGKNPIAIARDLNKVVDVGENRAKVIARTEIIRAHAEGQLTAFETLGVEDLGVAVEWSTAAGTGATVEQMDALGVCKLCQPLSGVVVKIEEARGMLPRHPQCLPGYVPVLTRSGITATSERGFEGNLVVVRTTSGRELSCTPNHPILTESGWVPAQSLQVGGHVISDGGSEWEPFIDDDHENVPPSIHQVSESFRSSRSVVTSEVPLTPPDFHGDGTYGQVAVIRSDRQLRDRRKPSTGEHPSKSYLVVRPVNPVRLLTASRLFTEFLERAYSATACFVSGNRLLLPLSDPHLRPLQYLSLTPAPNRNPCYYQNSIDSSPADAQLVTDILRGSTGPVFRDDIVSVTVRKFNGHVYNLETGKGFYSAGGIITHNCRCAWVPANVGEDDKDQKDTRGAILGAIRRSQKRDTKDENGAWGPGKSIQKTRPEPIITK